MVTPPNLEKARRKPRRAVLFRRYLVDKASQREIAKECGVTQPDVHVWLKRDGLLKLRQELDHQDWLREMAETMSVTQIAKHCGVSRQAVYNWLNAAGLKAVDGRACVIPSLEELNEHGDKSMREIGEFYGVSRQRVYQWVQHHREQEAEA